MEVVDRISDMPDEVLEHILSFCTIKEAVRTSILSKRWTRIYACSNMNFPEDYFYGNRKKNRRLLNAIDKIILAPSQSTLTLVGNGIREFSIALRWTDTGMRKSCLQSKVDRWMKYLPLPHLTTLGFRLRSNNVEDLYDLSLSMLADAQSLQNLFLTQIHLTCLSPCDSLSSLRSLKLSFVKLDDEVMPQLLKGCPLLEILELQCIFSVKSLEVIGFIHLKMLTIHSVYLKNLHIDVANLEFLKLSLPKNTTMDMSTCALSLRQFELNHDASDLVIKLQLRGLPLPIDTWFSQFLSMCSLLEHLTISFYPTLDNVHLSTPFFALKTLRLFLKHTTSFKIVAPNLEKLFISVNKNLPFVELNASDKLEVEIMFYVVGRSEELLQDRLVKFLGFFSHSRVVKLSSFCGDLGYYFIPKEEWIKFHSPLYKTKYLEFSLYGNETKLFSEYLDYMLWLSPCATNLTIFWSNNIQFFLEFLYEDKAITENSNCSCCKLLSLKCWRHYLKEVRIKKFLGDEDDKADIKQFLWEEIENLSITETSFNPDSIYGGLYASYNRLFK